MISRRLKSNDVKRSKVLFVILSVLLIPVFTSCGGQEQHKDAVATVNGAAVPLQEFKKELAIYANRNPGFKLNTESVEEHLNMFIDKQIMIQEATKMGLAEDEIIGYYQEMKPGLTPRPLLKDVRDEIRLSLLEQKRQKAMEEWLQEARKGAAITIDVKKLSENYK